jgi:uncharacterized protein YyaL (SSP411 family)
MNGLKTLAVFAALALPSWSAPATNAEGPIPWQGWSDSVFDQAKRENKFVLLDLEAIWCHWCHVMDETTYKDPQVIKFLNSKYIPVRVDQDSRPDLSNRYEDYGWPATVVFGPDGKEIVKRQGYIEPKQMIAMMKAIIADPTPGPSVRPETTLKFGESYLLTPELRKDLENRFMISYDEKHGSWGFDQKYLEWASTELAMIRAKAGDAQADKMARTTLDQQRKLIDPAWGGVYQYSVGGDWNEPHFEKIMQFQAENMRIFSMAYEQYKEPQYLQNAKDIEHYLRTFLLSPEGSFYTSQNADVINGVHSDGYFKLDDAGRRKQGLPRVDKHRYSRENGWAINGLATLYAATSDAQYLDEARHAMDWIVANRALGEGGFRHDEKDAAGPYLGDTLAMARALLTLYGATGDRQLLAKAEAAAKFMEANFKDPAAGYMTAKTPTDRSYMPKPERDENIAVARFANLLSFYAGDEQYKKMAEHAMRYLVEEHIAKFMPTAGILMANQELSMDPTHITIVGHKDDATAQALFHQAMSFPLAYKRVEWWDTREGRLPNPDVQYPELSKAAAFVCTANTCSSPIFQPDALLAKVDKLTAKRTE